MIGLDEVRGAAQTLKEYKNGKRALENRIVANEQWWKLRHWGQMRGRGAEDQVEPVSAWLFNTILNKHADAMDNQPEPVRAAERRGRRGRGTGAGRGAAGHTGAMRNAAAVLRLVVV